MAEKNLTLKERVGNLEKIVEELAQILQKGSFKTIQDLDEDIKETIKTKLEEAESELADIKQEAENELANVKQEVSRQIGKVPEILDEMCQAFENETGVNLVLLRKKIREL